MATIGDVARLRRRLSQHRLLCPLRQAGDLPSRPASASTTAIDELGFTPNAGARALATSQTMVIGLFVQFFRDEFSPAMLQYVLPISDAARESGYDILMVTEEDGPRALQRITDSEMVDGVVLLERRPRRSPGRPVARARASQGRSSDFHGH